MCAIAYRLGPTCDRIGVRCRALALLYTLASTRDWSLDTNRSGGWGLLALTSTVARRALASPRGARGMRGRAPRRGRGDATRPGAGGARVLLALTVSPRGGPDCRTPVVSVGALTRRDLGCESVTERAARGACAPAPRGRPATGKVAGRAAAGRQRKVATRTAYGRRARAGSCVPARSSPAGIVTRGRVADRNALRVRERRGRRPLGPRLLGPSRARGGAGG